MVKQKWYIHPMNTYSTVKGKEFLIHPTTWMDLKGIILIFKKANLQRSQGVWCISVTVLKLQNYGDGIQMSDFQGLEMVGMRVMREEGLTR